MLSCTADVSSYKKNKYAQVVFVVLFWCVCVCVCVCVWKEGLFYLTTHSTHFILRLYGVGHMVKDHSERVREETRCRHMGYSSRLPARVLLYAPSYRQDSTY